MCFRGPDTWTPCSGPIAARECTPPKLHAHCDRSSWPSWCHGLQPLSAWLANSGVVHDVSTMCHIPAAAHQAKAGGASRHSTPDGTQRPLVKQVVRFASLGFAPSPTLPSRWAAHALVLACPLSRTCRWGCEPSRSERHAEILPSATEAVSSQHAAGTGAPSCVQGRARCLAQTPKPCIHLPKYSAGSKSPLGCRA